MLTRWHTLSLIVLLLFSNLSARAQCSLDTTFLKVTGGTCTTVACTTTTFLYLKYYKPSFVVKCDTDRDYFILRVLIDHQKLFSILPTGIDSTGNINYVATMNDYLDVNFTQSVNFYIWDGQMDWVPSGTGNFKSSSGVNEFTIFGATQYQFTFNNSIVSGLEIQTSQLPNCKAFFGEKILKANDSNSAMYQCSLFAETVNNPPHSGLGGCVPHRCQYYADRKMVTFCNLSYNDDDCYFKAEHVWMIGTEYDLSSLPKILLLIAFTLLFFHGLATGLKVS